MSLRDRLHAQGALGADPALLVGDPRLGLEAGPERSEPFEAVKSLIHSRLVDALDRVSVDQLSHTDVSRLATQLLTDHLATDRIPMSRAEREALVQELAEDVLGLGPLEPLLRDPTVSDILVNGPRQVYVERYGRLQRTRITFRDDAHLMHVIDRIVSAVGRRVDEKTPMVDARLKDGSRVNAIIPPLAIDGPALSIRKFRREAGSLDQLLNWGALTPAMAQTLEAAVKCRLNIVISGGTGAGKTTLLNSLSSIIPVDERIVTIEDSAELQLQQDHVVRLETRPPNIEGTGEIEARHLVINALRMRPDRIVIGECRGPEALDMLQAMNTGHDGSLTTLHANSPRDALSRIETMCMMTSHPLPEKTLRQQIASAVHLIIQVNRLQDGARKVTSIAELTGMEGQTIALQEIFRFEQLGLDEQGRVLGRHVATGVRPRFAEVCQSKGLTLTPEWFRSGESLPESLPEAEPAPAPALDVMKSLGLILGAEVDPQQSLKDRLSRRLPPGG